jgi:hypothetical protein
VKIFRLTRNIGSPVEEVVFRATLPANTQGGPRYDGSERQFPGCTKQNRASLLDSMEYEAVRR